MVVVTTMVSVDIGLPMALAVPVLPVPVLMMTVTVPVPVPAAPAMLAATLVSVPVSPVAPEALVISPSLNDSMVKNEKRWFTCNLPVYLANTARKYQRCKFDTKKS